MRTIFAAVLSCVALLIIFVEPARARECADYGVFPTRVIGEFTTSDEATDIFMVGDLVYVGSYGTLTVVDISDPDAPREVAVLEGFQSINDIIVDGIWAYVSDRSGMGIWVVTLFDPEAPQISTNFGPTSSWVNALTKSGDSLYAVYNDGSLRIYDTTAPWLPQEVGSADYFSRATDIVVSDGYAYLARQSDGLIVVDVSDPALPFWVDATVPGFEPTSYEPRIELVGQMAYIATGLHGLQAFDVSDPTQPYLVSETSLPRNKAEGVAYDNGVVYVAAGGLATASATFALSLADPGSPEIIGFFPSGYSPSEIEIAGGSAVVAVRDGVQLVDIRHPGSELSGFLFEDLRSQAAVGYGHAFFSLGNSLVAVNLPADGNPEVVGSLPFNTDALSLTPDGRHLCLKVRPFSNNLGVANVEDPSNPVLLGQVHAEPDVIQTTNTHAFAAESKIRVIDITSPSVPQVVDSLWPGDENDASHSIHDLVLQENHLLSVSTAGLKMFDITNPVDSSVLLDHRVTGLKFGAVAGDFIYTADSDGIVRVFDISSPSAVEQIQMLPTVSGVTEFVLGDGGIYLGASQAGGGTLVVLDANTPGTIWQVAHHELPGPPIGISVRNHSVYVAVTSFGLLVFPEHCLESVPTRLMRFDVQWKSNGVRAEWVAPVEPREGFTLEATVGTRAWRVPVKRLGQDLYQAHDATALEHDGEVRYRLFEGSSESGELLAEKTVRSPDLGWTIRFVGSAPNPFNPRTMIQFELGRPQRVQLTVFDSAGRRVKRLADQTFPAGSSELPWLGFDETGSPAASGVYHVRLQSESGFDAMKLNLIR